MVLESVEEYEQNILKCVTSDHIASDLIVAVMTVCGNIGTGVNLLKIFDLYIEQPDEKIFQNFELNYVPNSKKTNDGKKNKAFYNCLSVLFYYKDPNSVESKIAAKVFPNGSIQLAGCRTIESVHNAPVILFNFIQRFKDLDVPVKDKLKTELQNIFEIRSHVFGECKKYQKTLIDEINNNVQPQIIIQDIDSLKLQDVRIVMINSNFVFQHANDQGTIAQTGIIQERLKNIINNNKFEGKEDPNRQWRMATYQPEKYAGVNIRYWTKTARQRYASYFTDGRKLPKKIEGQIGIFVFRSGKGTITAAKNSKDLLEAYQSICKLVRENSDELFYKANQVPGNSKENVELKVITGELRGKIISHSDLKTIQKGIRVSCPKSKFKLITKGIKTKDVATSEQNNYFTIV